MTKTIQPNRTDSDTSILMEDFKTLAKDASEIAHRSIVEPTQDKINEVAHSVRQQTRQGKRRLRRDRQMIEKSIRQHPIATAGIAFGAGLVTGLVAVAALTPASEETSED